MRRGLSGCCSKTIQVAAKRNTTTTSRHLLIAAIVACFTLAVDKCHMGAEGRLLRGIRFRSRHRGPDAYDILNNYVNQEPITEILMNGDYQPSASNRHPRLRYPPALKGEDFVDYQGGHFSHSPLYEDDAPAPDHYQGPVPFGLPMGGISRRGSGPAYGLSSYLARGIPFEDLMASMKREYFEAVQQHTFQALRNSYHTSVFDNNVDSLGDIDDQFQWAAVLYGAKR